MGYGHGIVGHVALTRRSLNITNAYADPRFNQLSDLKTGFKTHSILTVPITDRKGTAVAVIQAVSSDKHAELREANRLCVADQTVPLNQLRTFSHFFSRLFVYFF